MINQLYSVKELKSSWPMAMSEWHNQCICFVGVFSDFGRSCLFVQRCQGTLGLCPYTVCGLLSFDFSFDCLVACLTLCPLQFVAYSYVLSSLTKALAFLSDVWQPTSLTHLGLIVVKTYRNLLISRDWYCMAEKSYCWSFTDGSIW